MLFIDVDLCDPFGKPITYVQLYSLLSRYDINLSHEPTLYLQSIFETLTWKNVLDYRNMNYYCKF